MPGVNRLPAASNLIVRQTALLALLSLMGLAAATSGPSPARSVSKPIPTIHLEIAVREKMNGKVGKEILMFRLDCFSGHLRSGAQVSKPHCTLDLLRLNKCEPTILDGYHQAGLLKPEGPGPTGFRPSVDARMSTEDGTLQVKNVDGVLNIESGPPGKPKDEHILWGYVEGDSGFTTSFSGGFVIPAHPEMKQTNPELEHPITVEYVPFVGMEEVAPLDCGLLVPGVLTDREKGMPVVTGEAPTAPGKAAP